MAAMLAKVLPMSLRRAVAPSLSLARRGLAASAVAKEENTPVTIAYGDGIGPEVRDESIRESVCVRV
jgi:hypothetical protein